MKNETRPPAGITRERFAELVRASDGLAKIEATLPLPSPSEGFRDWLLKELWHFYQNTEDTAGNSRAILKKELRQAVRLATELRLSASHLSQSREAATALGDFVEWQSWQPMHPSGIPLIGLLDEFAKRIGLFVDRLSDDQGGTRPKKAFDDLLTSLGQYYRASIHESGRPIEDPHFFKFAAAVTDMLRDLKIGGPHVPHSDGALRQRLRRLSARRR
jgi:hypothetical protein